MAFSGRVTEYNGLCLCLSVHATNCAVDVEATHLHAYATARLMLHAGRKMSQLRSSSKKAHEKVTEQNRVSCVCHVSCRALPYANVPFICVIER